jgi:hypothetical protein
VVARFWAGLLLFVAAVVLWVVLQSFASDPFASYHDPADVSRPYRERVQSCKLAGGVWDIYSESCLTGR